MSRQMKCVACVLGVVAIVLSAGMVQAETIYSANADLYASEMGALPSATFGVWSIGYRSTAEGAVSTAFHSDGYHYVDSNLSGWCFNNTVVSDVLVNKTGAPLTTGPNGEVYGTDVMHIHPGVAGAGGEYAVLRWTAPVAGTVNVATSMRMWETVAPYGDGVDVHLVLNGTSLYDNNLWQKGTVAADANLTGVAVNVGDKLDFVLGNGLTHPKLDEIHVSDATAVYHSVTYVPEPSSCVLLAIGLTGLLTYAWRRRK